MLICFLFIFSSFAAALDEINFSFTKPAGTPYIVGAPEMNVDAEEFTTLIIKIKSVKSGTARLFWASSLDQQMNEPKSLWFFLNKSDSPKEYVFNVKSQNPYWIGFIPQILIFPDGGSQGVEIESAKAIPGDLFTNIRSGWREFWGPKGRVVIGSTINLIPSSSFFGRSINLYVYWLIGLGFLFLFTLNYYKSQKANKKTKKKDQAIFYSIFQESGKQTLFLAFFFWILLTFSSYFNYFNIFKDNFSKYFGKSIEAKREITYGKDFYKYLAFAKEKLPKKPVKFAFLSSRYAAELQARIYLIPHVLTRDISQEAEYLLFFQSDPNQHVNKTFSFYAKFADGQYIMKKVQ
ncbi:MAG: hypothetical protein ABIH50_08170 [bacterium]